MSKDRTVAERDQGILLQSGTNEVELLEFLLGDQGFGVNVAKIQAIEQFDPSRVTKLPMAHRAMAGMLLFRGRTLPLIDLRSEMGNALAAPGEQGGESDSEAVHTKVILVQEFNKFATGFVADGVRRIHRVSWEDVYPLASLIAKSNAPFTGSFHIDEREILIVDMERIMAEIFPQSFREEMMALVEATDHEQAHLRPNVHVVLAEDSSVIRTMLMEVLSQGGYSDVRSYGNGREAYEAIAAMKASQAASDGSELNAVLISDIEMPCMDGLALCRHVKETLGLRKMPVIMFSSLINEQMAEKCRSVGADAYISKPEFAKLVGLIDQNCLGAAAAQMPCGPASESKTENRPAVA